VEFSVQKAEQELHKVKPAVHPQLYLLLKSYDFPGNIRELEALIFDAVSRNEQDAPVISYLTDTIKPRLPAEVTGGKDMPEDVDAVFSSMNRLPTIAGSEKLLIQEAMYVEADVNLYPLAGEYLQHPVHDFVKLLEKHGCLVENGPTSSIVKGESETVFEALGPDYEEAVLKSGCVLIIKICNVCPL
jgi:DNA-binding NtrC family response regulator